MRILMLGGPDEIRGFTLAGVQSTACATSAAARRAAASLLAEPEGQTAVVFVSRAVLGLAPEAFARLDAQSRWPIVVELPEGADGEERPA